MAFDLNILTSNLHEVFSNTPQSTMQSTTQFVSSLTPHQTPQLKIIEIKLLIY